MSGGRDPWCPECMGSGWLPALGSTDWPEPEERCPYCAGSAPQRPQEPATLRPLPSTTPGGPEPHSGPQGTAPGRLSERHPQEQALPAPPEPPGWHLGPRTEAERLAYRALLGDSDIEDVQGDAGPTP